MLGGPCSRTQGPLTAVQWRVSLSGFHRNHTRSGDIPVARFEQGALRTLQSNSDKVPTENWALCASQTPMSRASVEAHSFSGESHSCWGLCTLPGTEGFLVRCCPHALGVRASLGFWEGLCYLIALGTQHTKPPDPDSGVLRAGLFRFGEQTYSSTKVCCIPTKCMRGCDERTGQVEGYLRHNPVSRASGALARVNP